MDLFSYIQREIPLSEFFEAYYECRQNKRWKENPLSFEVNHEKELIKLHKEVNSGEYEVGRSIAFIVSQPVYREIFASDFRDRIVHHLMIRKLNPYFEKVFIYDSYACRIGKGTLFGIKRVERFVRQCSENYSKDCYILKLDIKAFFANINRKQLWGKLESFIIKNYRGDDIDIVLQTVRKVILNDPTKGAFKKSPKQMWNKLERSKILTNAPKDCGLPSGNLTSQVFANFFMNDFDHFIKHTMGIRYYGRYVDDFVIVHNNKEFLKEFRNTISEYLAQNLGLTLHPNKIYLQHYTKGVKFIGAVIKPFRTYVSSRTMGNFYQLITDYNKISYINDEVSDKFINRANSYLGFMVHHNSYQYRVKTASRLSIDWWCRVAMTNRCSKFIKSDYHFLAVDIL